MVCFGAEWCPYARRFVPRFAGRKSAIAGTFALADITDLKDPLWDTFRIRVTPSIVVFRDGVEVARLDGRRFLGITDGAYARFEQAFAPPPSGVP